jgi:CRP/FNR family transcriptional regulator
MSAALTMPERMNTVGRSFDALPRSAVNGGGRWTAGCGAAARVCYCSRMDPSEREAIDLLANVPVFETLGPRELTRVAAVSVPRSFDPGHVIFREGDASDTCYIVRSGHARAIRAHGDGRTLTLAHFGPGDIFGELAMFDDERRSATVETLDRLEAVAVLGPDMRRLLREHPDISVKLVIALGRRLREANERIARQSFQTVQSRVAGVLAQLVLQAQAEGAGGRDVLVVVTQSDVAQLAGSSRESASRFLAVLERAGVVTQGRGRLTVHDPEALKRYVY